MQNVPNHINADKANFTIEMQDRTVEANTATEVLYYVNTGKLEDWLLKGNTETFIGNSFIIHRNRPTNTQSVSLDTNKAKSANAVVVLPTGEQALYLHPVVWDKDNDSTAKIICISLNGNAVPTYNHDFKAVYYNCVLPLKY